MQIIDATGDVVVGDTIAFTEAVWPAYSPSRRSGRHPLGERTIVARVLKDSYGDFKQQHTFTLEEVAASGFAAPAPGTRLLRKGRNIYRRGVTREPWADESQRELVRAEKHARGDAARRARAERRLMQEEDENGTQAFM
jgi:hypothetical protein